MSYPPPQGYPGGPPQDPYGQQGGAYGGQYPGAGDPYGQPQQPPVDPYAQPPADPYGQPPSDPYGQPQYPHNDGGWGSPPQSAPAQPGYLDQSYPMSGVPMSGQPMTGPPGPPPVGGGYPPMFSQPPKKNNTPVVVGVILTVVLLLGLGTVLIFTLGGDDEGKTTVEPTTDAPSESTSESPSETPDDRVVSGEFAVDWSGEYEGVSLSATSSDSWDYDGCAEVESGGILTAAGCQYALELVHDAEGGDLRIAQLIMGMTDADAAVSLEATLANEEFEESYIFQSSGFIRDYEEGLWWSEDSGRFVIVTIATRTSAVDTETLEAYLYGKSDDTVADLASR